MLTATMGRARRIFVAVAVTLLTIPAIGTAVPIVAPPIRQSLVEGHAVFAVVEAQAFTDRTRAQFAAAVAVLVRERDEVRRAERFPGVLWFDDQYLVNPEDDSIDGHAGIDAFLGKGDWRYPCGGAVLAVNAGDPDPRVAIARVNVSEFPPPLPSELSVESPEGADTYGEDLAWLDVEANLTTSYLAARSDTALRTLREYEESYLITDPNDHMWIIDKYRYYLSDTVGGPLGWQSYDYSVWVVNVLGSPAFVPDDGVTSCVPFADVMDAAALAPLCQNANEATGADGLPLDCGQSVLHRGTCGLGVPNGYDSTDDGPSWMGSRPFVDDPCAGYREPSRNGYCYGGQSAAAVDCSDPTAARLRSYNAVLYFDLADLRVPDHPRDHTDPVNGGDTNGCHEPSPGASGGDEWPCPSVGEHAEGNSHPFHPTGGALHTAEPCPPRFAGANPVNHGGSTDPAARCDYVHATRNVEIYFGGRPFPPPVRRFALIDLEGSSAPFHDDKRAYGIP